MLLGVWVELAVGKLKVFKSRISFVICQLE